MQNGSKYVPPHLRNRCNGVPSVHVDNDKTSHVIGFCHNYVPPHLRNRIRQIDCEYVPPHLRKRLHGVPSEKTYKKTIEVTDDHANLDADQDDTNRDVADQGSTTNNRKVVNNRADQEEDMNIDTSDQETTSGNRDVVSNFKNETEILSEVNDFTADDSIVISNDNKSDIATSEEDGFFSCPEAGCDGPSGNQIPTLGSLAKLGMLKIPIEIRTPLASSDIAADTTSDRRIDTAIDTASEVTDIVSDEPIDTSRGKSEIATSKESNVEP